MVDGMESKRNPVARAPAYSCMKERPFAQSIARLAFALTTLATVSVGAAWIVYDGLRIVSDRDATDDEIIANSSRAVQARVTDLVDFFRADIAAADERIESRLVSFLDIARAVADGVASGDTDASLDQRRGIVFEALRPVALRDTEWFAVYDDTGTALFDPFNPEFEGRNRINGRGGGGAYEVRSAIELAQWGVGVLPGSCGLTVVGRLPAIDAIAAIGECVDVARADSAARLIASLANVTLDDDEYIFGGTYEGVSLVGPRVGQNMRDVTDVEGTYVVRELVQAARSGGGFVEYVLPEETGRDPVPKRSYVAGIDELGWYIGIGFNLATADTLAARRAEELIRALWIQIATILGLLALLLLAAWILTRYLSRRLAEPVQHMLSFANAAASGTELLAEGNLRFAEFHALAGAINSMVGDLRRSVEDKRVLLREIHHRVKNNLQIVASILNIDSSRVESEAALRVFEQTKRRIDSMALVHEKLYRSAEIERLDVGAYLDELVRQVLYGAARDATKWDFTLTIEHVSLSLDTAIPLGLIATELVSNAVKHGGSRESGVDPVLELAFVKREHGMELSVSDNGPGIPHEEAKAVDANGIGLTLIDALAAQLEGRVVFAGPPGCTATLVLPG